MKISRKIKLLFAIYISIILPLISTFVTYSNKELLPQNILAYSSENNNGECAVVELNNKNFNKLILIKISQKVKQGNIVIEKSFVLVCIATKITSQLNQPLRC